MPLVHYDVRRVDLVVVENYELPVRSASLLTISKDGVVLAGLKCLQQSFDIWLDFVGVDPIATTDLSKRDKAQPTHFNPILNQLQDTN